MTSALPSLVVLLALNRDCCARMSVVRPDGAPTSAAAATVPSCNAGADDEDEDAEPDASSTSMLTNVSISCGAEATHGSAFLGAAVVSVVDVSLDAPSSFCSGASLVVLSDIGISHDSIWLGKSSPAWPILTAEPNSFASLTVGFALSSVGATAAGEISTSLA